jgi:polyisoprenoid-binding protein YceI
MFRHTRLILGLVTTTFCIGAFAADGPLKVKVGLYPMGSFEITGDHVDGTAAKELKVEVDTLKTGMSLRDRHLHEKLESDKYKFITVSNVKAKDGSGTADIKIHNVSKNVPFTYKDADSGKATATFKLSLKDYNLTNINYKGVGVEDEVEVTATVPKE